MKPVYTRAPVNRSPQEVWPYEYAVMGERGYLTYHRFYYTLSDSYYNWEAARGSRLGQLVGEVIAIDLRARTPLTDE